MKTIENKNIPNVMKLFDAKSMLKRFGFNKL